MPIVYQWIFFLYTLLYWLSQHFYQKDAITTLSLVKKLRFKEVEWFSQGYTVSVKVVWRPRKANSGKHSSHFVVRIPFHDSEEWWGWKAAHGRVKGRLGPGKWIEHVWAMFWRTLADGGSQVGLMLVICDKQWKWRWRVWMTQVGFYRKADEQGSWEERARWWIHIFINFASPVLGTKPTHRKSSLNFAKRRKEKGVRWEKKMEGIRSSCCGSAVTNLTSIHEDVGLMPDLGQWVKDLALPWAAV